MNVLHVSYTSPPDPCGGTEMYIWALARALATHGVLSGVTAPAAHAAEYVVDGVGVHRFACAASDMSLSALYGAGHPASTASFSEVLDRVKPDVVHQHALSPACSVDVARLARGRGVPVVFTFHTPTVSCQRGTLLRMGTDECDGRLDVEACTACVLDDLGVNAVMRRLVAAVPADVGRLIGRRDLSGGIWTALRMRELMTRRIEEIRALFGLVDRIVVLTPWVARLLEANGVEAARIVVSPHGVESGRPVPARAPRGAGPIRLAHLGRLDPVKGTALLLGAMAAAPDADVTLDVYGIRQSSDDRALFDTLRRLASADRRISLYDALPHAAVIDTLRAYDGVVVPSQGMETGPLVVLEAFAAGVPVLGSALGGIAEKIQHDVNGLLIAPFHSVPAWTEVIHRCAVERDLLPRLRSGVSRPRHIDAVAADMARVYTAVTLVSPVRVGHP